MNKLLQAVETGDISEVEIYLKAFITGNPTDSDNSIKSALKQIKMKKLNIWEPHDGATFNTNRAEWTEDYFVDLQVDLRMNFSKERFMHMLEVGKVAFPTSIEKPKLATQPKVKVSKSTTHTTNSSNNGTDRKKDKTLLYVGIAGITIVILGMILVKLVNND